MVISTKFDRAMCLESANRISRSVQSIGDITLYYGLYEINIGAAMYIAAVSDGSETAFRAFALRQQAEKLFSVSSQNGIDPASFDSVADDLMLEPILNNIL